MQAAATDHNDITSTPLWQDGWYSFARHLASPNFGARPAGTLTELLVIHSISLPPGQYGTNQVQRLFTNTLDWDSHDYFRSIRGLKVSSHFSSHAMGSCGSSSAAMIAPGTPASPFTAASPIAMTIRSALN